VNISPIAILIVSYNVCATLQRALHSLGTQFPIVVVDNASHDGSAAMVQRQFPHVTLLALRENIGFGAAVNRAAGYAHATHFLLLNPDAWLDAGSLTDMVDHLTTYKNKWGATALGFRQVDEAGLLQLSFGPPPTLWGELGRKLIQRHFDAKTTTLARLTRAWIDRTFSQARVVSWVAGSALLVERAAFWRIGGFDPGFFLFFEDIDFCLRLACAGGAVVYDPSITVGHSRGVSARKAATLSARAYRDSQARFAQLHQGVWTGRLIARWAAHRRPDTQPVPALPSVP
jgi:N-acetylglucosaminyl-diphospho-decaprenol L-rhamnosyltransferase